MEAEMKTATFTEFRNQAKKYFDAVQDGESIEIYRHGKPVAILTPVSKRSQERWKTARPLALSGVSLSHAVLADREDDR
jgi:prevent-host-death family protein